MVIGFTAPAGSGKTEACKYIESIHPDAVRVGMKVPLIHEMRRNLPDVLSALAKIYKMSVDELFEKKPPAMRALMQNYGTEVRRRDRPDYWVRRWLILAQQQIDDSKIVLVDDIRFPNEAEAVKRKRGVIVRINRIDLKSTSTHESERLMADIEADYTITTSMGKLDELFDDIEALMGRLKLL